MNSIMRTLRAFLEKRRCKTTYVRCETIATFWMTLLSQIFARSFGADLSSRRSTSAALLAIFDPIISTVAILMADASSHLASPPTLNREQQWLAKAITRRRYYIVVLEHKGERRQEPDASDRIRGSILE